MCNYTIHLLESFIEIGSSVSLQNYTFYRPLIFIVNYLHKENLFKGIFFSLTLFTTTALNFYLFFDRSL